MDHDDNETLPDLDSICWVLAPKSLIKKRVSVSREDLFADSICIFCFVFITIDQIKALNFYFYIKTTFRSLLHLQVKDYTNFE